MAQNGLVKIAVVGAESTGKTWLCERLAQHYGTVWVPEYARDYFDNSDIYNYTIGDLESIAQRQLQLEEELLPEARRFLFCDTTLVTLKIWAELEFQLTPPFIASHLSTQPYDHYFITSNEVPWMEDPLRQNKHSRDTLFQMNEAEVKRSGIAYTVISGTDDERLTNAIKAIDARYS